MNHIGLEHSHEIGFSVTCGLNGCNNTFRKYEAFRKHVQRKHRDVVPRVRRSAQSRTENSSEDNTANAASSPPTDVGAESTPPSEAYHESNDPIAYMSSMLNRMKRHLVLLSLKVTESHLLPQSVCESIFKDMKVLLELLLEACKTYFAMLLSSGRVVANSDDDMLSVLSGDVMDMIWEVTRSEHARLNYVKEHFPFVQPKEINLDDSINARSGRHVFYYVPVQDMLRNLVSADLGEHVLSTLQGRNNDSFDANTLTDVCDGDFARSRAVIEEGVVGTLLLLLYTDELEVTNPIGAARGVHKLLVVYVNLLNLHPRYRSTLESIHLVLIVKYTLLKQYGLNRIMEPLIADLNSLQSNGLDVVLNGSTVYMKACVVGFSGDNLSLNRLGGFSCSFTAGRVCRHCLASSTNLQSLTDESKCTLRTAEAHNSHVAAVQLSPDNARLYGVKEPSCLLALNGFDVTCQLLPDLMHDVLEGGINTVLKSVLNTLLSSRVLQREHFTVAEKFQYKRHDMKNKPFPLALTNAGKMQNIRGTASQKLCLFRLLPQLFGDNIPEGNPDWNVYLQYREIVNVLLSDRIPSDCVEWLEVQIASFLEAFVQRYPEVKVTPKLHYLIHYPRYISLYGPPRNFSSMRFEAKHATLKTIAVRARSFLNIAKTVAMRVQLGQCYNSICSAITHDLEVPVVKDVQWEDLPVLVRDSFVLRPLPGERISEARMATVHSSTYTEGDVLCMGWEDEAPAFGQILKLVIFRGSLLIFLHALYTCGFMRHRQAYQVVFTDSCVQISPGDEHNPRPLDLYRYKNHHEIVPHFELFEL
ncbi:uncharacterized protein LOC135392429 [Ornithodoros turicata]|uniref:uncharacterized protein LOC135392429 n=1 Tax=Ornithodoros turicata TaxID=34597 RepID=UPI003139082C